MCSVGGAEGVNTQVCGEEGNLAVSFDSRSYLLTEYAGQCTNTPFATQDYECVDYAAGAVQLSGKTLSFDVDLSGVGCGCNAALYLVSMPQSSEKGNCGNDYYCDANSVCGVSCVELDLLEGNKIAWVSTVHVADDPDGEGFGYGHYVQAAEKQFVSSDERFSCAYGPSNTCTINTERPFTADVAFSGPGNDFWFEVVLSQYGRTATLGPVRYTGKPPKGITATPEEANAILRGALDSGMTLAVSYWSGAAKKDMAWLDTKCHANEIADWGCTDVWVEHPEWAWQCDPTDETPPNCAASASAFILRSMSIRSPSPPPMPPPAPLTYSQGFGAGMFVGMTACLVLFAALFVLWKACPPRAKTMPVREKSIHFSAKGSSGASGGTFKHEKGRRAGEDSASLVMGQEGELDEEELSNAYRVPKPAPATPTAAASDPTADAFDAKEAQLVQQPNVFDAKDQELRQAAVFGPPLIELSDGADGPPQTSAYPPARSGSPTILPYGQYTGSVASEVLPYRL